MKIHIVFTLIRLVIFFFFRLLVQDPNPVNGRGDTASSSFMVPVSGVALRDDDQLRLYSDSPDLYQQELLLRSSARRSPEPSKSRKCLQSSNVPATEEGRLDPIIKVIEVKHLDDGLEVSYTGETLTLTRALQLGLIPETDCLQVQEESRGDVSPSLSEDEPCEVNRLLIKSLSRRKSPTAERNVLTLRSGQDGGEEALARPSASGRCGDSLDVWIGGKSLVVDAAVQCDLMNSSSTLTVFRNQQHFIGLVVPPAGEIQSPFREDQSSTSESSSTASSRWWRIEAFYVPEYSEVVDVSEAVRQGLIDRHAAEVLRSVEIPEELPDADLLNDKFSTWLMYKKLMVDGCFHAAGCLEVGESPNPAESELLLISHLMINSYTDPKRGSRVLILDKQLNKMLKIFLEDPGERVVTRWSGSVGRVSDAEMPLHIEEEPEERGRPPPRHFVSSVNGGMSFPDKSLPCGDRAATRGSFADGDVDTDGWNDEITCERSENRLHGEPMEGLHRSNLQACSPGTPDKQTLPYFDPDGIFQNLVDLDDFDFLHLEADNNVQGLESPPARTESAGRSSLRASLSSSPADGRPAPQLFGSQPDCRLSDEEKMIPALDGFSSSTFTLSMTKRRSVSRSGCTISISESLEYDVVEDADGDAFGYDDEDFSLVYIGGDENGQQSTERKVTVLELDMTDVVAGGEACHQSWGRATPESCRRDEASLGPDDADVYSVWIGSTPGCGSDPEGQAVFSTSASSVTSDSPPAAGDDFSTEGGLSGSESDAASSHRNVLSGENAANAEPTRPDYTSAALGEAVIPAGGNDGRYGNGDTNRDTSPRNAAGLEFSRDIAAGGSLSAGESLREPCAASDKVATGNPELRNNTEAVKAMLVDEELTGSQRDAMAGAELATGYVCPRRNHGSSSNIPTDVESAPFSENTATVDEQDTFRGRMSSEQPESVVRFRPAAPPAGQQTLSNQTNVSLFLLGSCIVPDASPAALAENFDTVNQTLERVNVIVNRRGSNGGSADPSGPSELGCHSAGDGCTGLQWDTMAEGENHFPQRQHENSLNLHTDVKPVDVPENTTTRDEQGDLSDREAAQSSSSSSESIAGVRFGADASSAVDQQSPSGDPRHPQTPERQHENSSNIRTNLKPGVSSGNNATSKEQNTHSTLGLRFGQIRHPTDDSETLPMRTSASFSALPAVSDGVSQTPEWLHIGDGNAHHPTALPGARSHNKGDHSTNAGDDSPQRQHENGLNLRNDMNSASLSDNPPTRDKLRAVTGEEAVDTSSQQAEFAADALPADRHSPSNDPQGLSNRTDVRNVQPESCVVSDASSSALPEVSDFSNQTPEGASVPASLNEHDAGGSDSFVVPRRSSKVCSHEQSDAHARDPELSDARGAGKTALADGDAENIRGVPHHAESRAIEPSSEPESKGRFGADASPARQQFPSDDGERLQTGSRQSSVSHFLPVCCDMSDASTAALTEEVYASVLQKNTRSADNFTAPPRPSVECVHDTGDTEAARSYADDPEPSHTRVTPEAALTGEDIAAGDVSTERRHENIPVNMEPRSSSGQKAAAEVKNVFTDEAAEPTGTIVRCGAGNTATRNEQSTLANRAAVETNSEQSEPRTVGLRSRADASAAEQQSAAGDAEHLQADLPPQTPPSKARGDTHGGDSELSDTRRASEAVLANEDPIGSQPAAMTSTELAMEDVLNAKQLGNSVNTGLNVAPLSENTAAKDDPDTFIGGTTVQSTEPLESLARFGAEQQLPADDAEHLLSDLAVVPRVLPEGCFFGAVNKAPEEQPENNSDTAGPSTAPLPPSEASSHNEGEESTRLPLGAVAHVESSEGPVSTERRHTNSLNRPDDTKSAPLSDRPSASGEPKTLADREAVETNPQRAEFRADALPADHRWPLNDAEHLQTVSHQTDDPSPLALPKPPDAAIQTPGGDDLHVRPTENHTGRTDSFAVDPQPSKDCSHVKGETHGDDSGLSDAREAPEAALVGGGLPGSQRGTMAEADVANGDFDPDDVEPVPSGNGATREEQSIFTDQRAMLVGSQQESTGRFRADASPADQQSPPDDAEHLQADSDQTNVSNVLLGSCVLSDAPLAALSEPLEAPKTLDFDLQKEDGAATAKEPFESWQRDPPAQNSLNSALPMQEDGVEDEQAEHSGAPSIQLQLLRVLKTVTTSQDLSMLQEVMESLSATLGGPAPEEQQRHPLGIIQEEEDEGAMEEDLSHVAAGPPQPPAASVQKVSLILFDGRSAKLTSTPRLCE